MDAVLDSLDNSPLVVSLLVFLAVATIAFGAMAAMRVRREERPPRAQAALGPGGLPRSARGRVLLARAHRHGAAARGRRLPARSDLARRSGRRTVDRRRGRRARRLFRPEFLSQAPDPRPR